MLAFFAVGGLFILASDKLRADRQLHRKYLVYLAFAMALPVVIFLGWFRGLAVIVALAATAEAVRVARSRRLALAGAAGSLLLGGGMAWFAGENDPGLNFFLFLNVALFDGFSQLTGRAFGRTPITPWLSPGKTLEGLLGGLGVSTAVSMAWVWVAGLDPAQHLVLALLTSACAFSGDLLASLYKRLNEVKDFSQVIPYHGGVLDRFDSLLFAVPAMGLVGLLEPERTETLRALTDAVLIGAVFLTGEVLFRLFHVAAEVTRKVIHIGAGLVCLLLPLQFQQQEPVLVLCALFAAILALSRPLGFLPSLDSVGRPSQGSLYFPLAVWLCFTMQLDRGDQLYFYLPILLLTFGDAAAALAGRRWPRHPYPVWGEKKTLEGSAAFFGVSAVIAVLLLAFQGGPMFGLAAGLSCALAGTLAEAVSPRGLDNLSVPLVVVGVYECMSV